MLTYLLSYQLLVGAHRRIGTCLTSSLSLPLLHKQTLVGGASKIQPFDGLESESVVLKWPQNSFENEGYEKPEGGRER